MPEASAIAARLLRGALVAAGALPLPVLQRSGAALGWLAYLLNTRGARVCHDNITACFPELEAASRRQLARRAMMAAGETLFESLKAWSSEPGEVRRLIREINGQAEVDAINGAVIFIIPHLGNWEVINHYLGHRYGLTHMYQPFRSSAVETVIQSARARTGTRFVRSDRGGIKAQRRVLESGGAIGSMPDQEPAVHTGEFAPFFGSDCLTGTLIPTLANRTGATPVIASCTRLKAGRGFRVDLRPINEKLTPASMNAAIEQAIRSCPEQYLWTYKRFRTRPDGEPERYQFRQSLLRVGVEKVVLRALLYCSRQLALTTLRNLGATLGELALRLRLSAAADTRTNLAETGREPELIRTSLRESGKCLAETGTIWRGREVPLETDHVPALGGAIVLTLPLGNREVVMDFLAQQGRVIDYYHPNKHTSLDDLIRHQRTSRGIALAPETNRGIETLIAALKAGQTATLCPDQQPRLRGGLFVPFMGVPALTSLALHSIIARTGAPCHIAVAWRTETGFRLTFQTIEVSGAGDAVDTLTAINTSLEAMINQDPAQYRWSDRRFNIRPPGHRPSGHRPPGHRPSGQRKFYR